MSINTLAVDDPFTAKISHWLEQLVIAHNLCPFAKAPWAKGLVSLVVSQATTESALLEDLHAELERIAQASPAKLETTLLIVPNMLSDFLDFNDFLDLADGLLDQIELIGQIQIASFHPQYQFADTALNDVSNFTNRSPYPILHLLREDSITQALESGQDADQIVERNIETVTQLGLQHLAQLIAGVK